MLVIRLNRFGKRNQAQFRVVLQEKTKAPGHRHVEMLGSHNPHSKVTIFKKDRILYWIGQGAQPSDRVHNMLVKEGVIEGKITPKRMPRPVKKEEPPVEEKPAEEKPAEAQAGKKEEKALKVEEAATEAAPVVASAPAEATTPAEVAPTEAPKV
ncbi:MAG: 30S ribosomal protein S16 [Candidatus Moraniibacteriota bacterium]